MKITFRNLFVFAACHAAAAAGPPGLIHHWNFDEGPDWHDSAFGAAYAGTAAQDAEGGATAQLENMSSANWVSGRQFSGLQFDGATQKLTVAAGLAPQLSGSATLSFFINTTHPGSSAAATAPGVAGRAGAGGCQWGWLDEAGRMVFSVDGSPVVRSAAAVNDGKWHHVAITREASSGLAVIYIDGAESASGNGPAGERSLAFSSIGCIEGGGFFSGRLDQVSIFNRAITLAEASVLHSNHAPKTWNIATEGVSERPFSTASVFTRAYDVERDTLTVRSWTAPAHGSVVHNGDGSFTYTAQGGYAGPDSFEVTVDDGKGGYHRSAISLTILHDANRLPLLNYQGLAPVNAGGASISFNGYRTPRAVDWDADGKMDFLVGAAGYVWLYLNTGTASQPSFAAGVKVKAAGADIYAGNTAACAITLADMNADGVKDLVMCDSQNKLRIFRNTAAAGAQPVYAASVVLKRADGASDFISPGRRYDVGDYDGNGSPDLVSDSNGEVRLYLNAGSAADPRFETFTKLTSEAYNFSPRLFDLNGNGSLDLIRGINWGDVRYWPDAGDRGLATSALMTIGQPDGAAAALSPLTDGPTVDFADFNNDGEVDLLMGGNNGNGNAVGGKIHLAYGAPYTVADSIAEIEAVYDANPVNLGEALLANNKALLEVIKKANRNIGRHIDMGGLSVKEALFHALGAHIAKYPFLRYQTLDTAVYGPMPGIVMQNWVFLSWALPNNAASRSAGADYLGLTGGARQLHMETGLALGDNAVSFPQTYRNIIDMQRRHPRELFPDCILTFGIDRAGFVWEPASTKNTFSQGGGNADEWSSDLSSAIQKVAGARRQVGDGFTFTMAHEVNHSLDHYVNTRRNADLGRRRGRMLVTAGGPDCIPGPSGWIDWTATRNHFIAQGYYNPQTQTWRDGSATDAWELYWSSGPGAAWNNRSFMRGNIGWFLYTSQEALATQANQHWTYAPGRLIGAMARYRRGVETGNLPMKANINEVVNFIDYLSAGMNRINLVETKNVGPSEVAWTDHYAELTRDDRGRITRLVQGEHVYDFVSNENGIVVEASCNVVAPVNDQFIANSGQGQALNVLANDFTLSEAPLAVSSVTQPSSGSASLAADGRIVYQSNPGYTGRDSFAYTVGSRTANVSIMVVAGASAALETWLNVGGVSVGDLTRSSRFSQAADEMIPLSTLESPANRGNNFGARLRVCVVPPTTGEYTFWIASDDQSELWLSPNSTPADKVKICSLGQWVSPRAWSANSSQQSAPVYMEAGKRYYLEMLHKESNGGDHAAVAWSGPGIAQQIIGRPNIVTFGANTNPVAVADAIVMGNNATGLIPVLLNDSDPDGDTLSIQSVSQPASGAAVIEGGSIRYSPAPGYVGTVVLTCVVSDGNGGTATAAATVEVLNSDPAFDADGDGFTTGLELAVGANPYSAASQPPASLANLRAWWRFDEASGSVADDATGRPQDGVVTGAAWAGGKIGGGLNFAGPNHGVVMGAAPAILGAADFTVSAWFKRSLSSAGGVIIQQREVGPTGYHGQYALRILADGRPQFFVYGVGSYQFYLTGPSAISDLDWHLITATRQGPAGALYLDGNLAAAGTGSYTASLSPRGVCVGFDQRDNNRRFRGIIDDVRLYERALTGDQVAQLMGGSSPMASILDGYSLWASQMLPHGADAPEADANHDGISNLLSYAMGHTPASSAAQAPPFRLARAADGKLSLEYQRNTLARGALMVIESSSGLGEPRQWETVEVDEEVLSYQDGTQLRRAVMEPSPEDSRKFFRLRASR
jgi:hypothetical protein